MKIRNPKNNGGYTILELLIVMFIIVLLATIALTSYQKQRVRLTFDQSLINVNNLIKTARNYATTSKKTPDGIIPESGYGIYIDLAEKKFVLFANVSDEDNSDDQYDVNGIEPDDIIMDDSSYIDINGVPNSEGYFLPNTTNFESIMNENKTDIPGGKVVILFRPPLADTTITTNTSPYTTIHTLYMKFSSQLDPEDKRTIKINATAGFPEIELK